MASKEKAGGPDTTDSIDIAMGRARGSDQARDLMTSQSHLIFTQVLLARADLRHRGWQIIGERVGAILKIMTAVVGALVLFSVAAFLWSAHRASGMVVDPFSVPPTFAQQGLNGTVVAEQLLDKVVALEAGAQSARAKSSYEDSFSDGKGVVVPYAGVSLGEVRREARDWLGSETHLTGDVVRLPGNRLAVSFRTTAGLSGRVEGPDSEPDKLLDAAALAMFKATQPYRYSVYQSRHGNRAEAVATLQTLSRSDNLHERLWAMHGLALSAPTEAETVAIYRRLLDLEPNFVSALGNMPFYALNAGQEEEAFKGYQRAAKAYAAGAADYTPSYSQGFALDTRSNIAILKGDMSEAARQEEAADRTQGGGPTFIAARPFAAAENWAFAHDFAKSRAALSAAGFLDPARRKAAEGIAGSQLDLAGLLAAATDDQAGLVAAFERKLAAMRVETGDNVSLGEKIDTSIEETRIRGLMALSLARLGRIDEARRAVAGLAAESDPLIRARALIAAFAGDARGSDALFALASARTPSLPAAPLLWADALLHRGDAVHAEQRAREALRRGPNSAEAQRLLGEALLGQRKPADAERAFAAAARLEPQWGVVKMRWAEALWRLGKRDDARTKLAAAARMALNPADRALLGTMTRKANR